MESVMVENQPVVGRIRSADHVVFLVRGKDVRHESLGAVECEITDHPR